MGNYKINGKSLSDFGITAISANSSNLAVSGAWDLPKRKGNVSYEWKESDGVEAFVDADDMLFEGRSISFSGIMNLLAGQTIEQQMTAFRSYIDTISKGMFTLDSPWGVWKVQMSADLNIVRRGNSMAEIEITLLEPVPDLSGSLPQSTGIGNDIDSYAWEELGVYITSVSGASNIPLRKTIGVTSYEANNQVVYGGKQTQKIILSGLIIADDYEEFKKKIGGLYALFTKPGLREYRYNGAIYKCFAPDGFTINNLILASKVTATWDISLTTADDDE